jgi:hypothetical protein
MSANFAEYRSMLHHDSALDQLGFSPTLFLALLDNSYWIAASMKCRSLLTLGISGESFDICNNHGSALEADEPCLLQPAERP